MNPLPLDGFAQLSMQDPDTAVLLSGSDVFLFADGGFFPMELDAGRPDFIGVMANGDDVWLQRADGGLLLSSAGAPAVAWNAPVPCRVLTHGADGTVWCASTEGVATFLGSWALVSGAPCAGGQPTSVAVMSPTGAVLACTTSTQTDLRRVGGGSPVTVASYPSNDGGLEYVVAGRSSATAVFNAVVHPGGSAQSFRLYADGGLGPLTVPLVGRPVGVAADDQNVQVSSTSIYRASQFGWDRIYSGSASPLVADVIGDRGAFSVVQGFYWRDDAMTWRRISRYATSFPQENPLLIQASFARGGPFFVGTSFVQLPALQPLPLSASLTQGMYVSPVGHLVTTSLAFGSVREGMVDGGLTDAPSFVSGEFHAGTIDDGGTTWLCGSSASGALADGGVAWVDTLFLRRQGIWSRVDGGTAFGCRDARLQPPHVWLLGERGLREGAFSGDVQPIEAPDAGVFTSLCVLGPTEAWIASSEGVWRWDGGSWQLEFAASPPPTVLACSSQLPGRVVGVHDSTLARRSAQGAWSFERLPVSVRDLTLVPDAGVWVTTATGAVLRHP